MSQPNKLQPPMPPSRGPRSRSVSLSLRSRAAIRALALVVLAAGCDVEKQFPEPLAAVDGAVPERRISDASLLPPPPAEDAAEATDAPVPVAVADGGVAGDAQPLTVSVVIDSPGAGTIALVEKALAPMVTVTTDTGAPLAGDVLTDVSASLLRLPTRTMATTTKLNQVGLQTVPESNAMIYRFAETPMNLSGLMSGTYRLVVTAQTQSGAMGEASIDVQIDAGPTIRIDAPGDRKSFRGSAAVDLTVSDFVFGPVQDVQVTIGQVPLALNGPSATGQYTGTIDFAKFDPPLEGEQLITVRARNRNGTGAIAVRRFVSDNKGPTITNTIPKTGDLMGRVVTISAEIEDPAGVLDSSVRVVVAHGNNNYEFPLVPPAPGAMSKAYTYLFDTSKLPINALFPSITFRASDVLGNESSVGYLVSLDNMPPLSDLDPPQNFRSANRVDGRLICSWPLDPVGPDAVDDGDRVAQLFDIRARIEDQGNDPRSGGADFVPIATVTAADLLIMDDTSRALVVDSRRRADGPVAEEGRKEDPDGYCDEVNPALTISASPAASPDVLLITMAPINPTGTPDDTFDARLVGGACGPGSATKIPDPVCSTTYNHSKSDLADGHPHRTNQSVWIKYAGMLPSIWTIPPVVEDGLQCGGRQFDALANNLKDGWACVAVRATDRLGNQQVSRVLRVCIDHDGKGNECPHRELASVTGGSPMVVRTKEPHGLATGDVVLVSDVFPQTRANGRWAVTVVDQVTFSLNGSTGYSEIEDAANAGLFVKASELPDCTGTVTAAGPPATVDKNRPCRPWRLYPDVEWRLR